jgi:hypothetical protein
MTKQQALRTLQNYCFAYCYKPDEIAPRLNMGDLESFCNPNFNPKSFEKAHHIPMLAESLIRHFREDILPKLDQS